jgi:tRNA(Ile)-lysidine synthase
LLRGAGLEGLAGMHWSGRSPADPKIGLARPLLGFFKEDLVQYARTEDLQFREDQTNRSTDILRNRLRHELLPLLKKHYQPAINQTTLRLMEIVRAESEFIEHAVANLSTFGKRQFSLLPLAIQRRLIQIELINLGIEPNFGLIEDLRQSEDTAVMIRPETVVKRDSSGRLHINMVSRAAFDAERLTVSLEDSGGRLCFSGVEIDWSIDRVPEGKRIALKKREGTELFDAEKIGGSIVLRHWQPGDRFQPIGMSRSVKVQDLFVNKKIPRELRPRLLIVTTNAGETVWVEGLRISERFKLDKRSARQLKWSWRRV